MWAGTVGKFNALAWKKNKKKTPEGTDEQEARVSSSSATSPGKQSKTSGRAKEATSVAGSVVIGEGIATPIATTGIVTAGAYATAPGAMLAGAAAVVGLTAGSAALAASAVAGAGIPALAGELAGGYVGEKIGKGVAGDEGGKKGREIGKLGGATSAGAVAGAVIAGPVGAAAGAGAGVAGYAIGKATGKAVEKAAGWEGLAQHTAASKLKLAPSSCEVSDAAFCMVTEEGLGRCLYCFFQTEAEARAKFKQRWCSRILFTMESGLIVGEVQRGGWPWNQATILKAAECLRREVAVPEPCWPADGPGASC